MPEEQKKKRQPNLEYDENKDEQRMELCPVLTEDILVLQLLQQKQSLYEKVQCLSSTIRIILL